MFGLELKSTNIIGQNTAQCTTRVDSVTREAPSVRLIIIRVLRYVCVSHHHPYSMRIQINVL